ncbi:MAG: GNAT family N-acetyltransferase [Proteobacteria bacterium]|nr:GNAT family N-acetyltransferase [Pseudomonadota bacterium]
MNPILINIPETIETSRLKLVIPKAGFGKSVHEAILDGYEDYVKWMRWPSQPPSIESVEEDCRRQHAEFILRTFLRYLIIDKETSMVLGRCGFPSFQSDWQIPQFGISYFIRKSQRGKGYGTESVHALASLAFKFLKARKLEIYCDVDNKNSIKIPLKLNFEHEYTQRGGWLRENAELSVLNVYSLFSEKDLPSLKVFMA